MIFYQCEPPNTLSVYVFSTNRKGGECQNRTDIAALQVRSFPIKLIPHFILKSMSSRRRTSNLPSFTGQDGADCGGRTHDLLLTRQLLVPAELSRRNICTVTIIILVYNYFYIIFLTTSSYAPLERQNSYEL